MEKQRNMVRTKVDRNVDRPVVSAVSGSVIGSEDRKKYTQRKEMRRIYKAGK